MILLKDNVLYKKFIAESDSNTIGMILLNI